MKEVITNGNVKLFPHERSCADCRQANRCNYCGKENVKASNGRCTNGRCPECCNKHCEHVTRG